MLYLPYSSLLLHRATQEVTDPQDHLVNGYEFTVFVFCFFVVCFCSFNINDQRYNYISSFQINVTSAVISAICVNSRWICTLHVD